VVDEKLVQSNYCIQFLDGQGPKEKNEILRPCQPPWNRSRAVTFIGITMVIFPWNVNISVGLNVKMRNTGMFQRGKNEMRRVGYLFMAVSIFLSASVQHFLASMATMPLWEFNLDTDSIFTNSLLQEGAWRFFYWRSDSWINITVFK